MSDKEYTVIGTNVVIDCGTVEEAIAYAEGLREALALADSMIRSGERHTPQSEAIIRAALTQPAAPAACPLCPHLMHLHDPEGHCGGGCH